jgi:hypothetical protein
LIDALARAEELGFKPADEDLETFVNWLDPYNREHKFRYVKPGFKQVPTMKDLVSVLEGLYEQVEPIATAHIKRRTRHRRPSRKRICDGFGYCYGTA